MCLEFLVCLIVCYYFVKRDFDDGFRVLLLSLKGFDMLTSLFNNEICFFMVLVRSMYLDGFLSHALFKYTFILSILSISY